MNGWLLRVKRWRCRRVGHWWRQERIMFGGLSTHRVCARCGHEAEGGEW